jgi:hypothetical protein
VSNWRELFRAAQLKTNPLDLQQRVTAAQQAIDERMRELIQENIQASKEEREIRDAVQTLKVLRREIEENKRRTAGCPTHEEHILRILGEATEPVSAEPELSAWWHNQRNRRLHNSRFPTALDLTLANLSAADIRVNGYLPPLQEPLRNVEAVLVELTPVPQFF